MNFIEKHFHFNTKRFLFFLGFVLVLYLIFCVMQAYVKRGYYGHPRISQPNDHAERINDNDLDNGNLNDMGR